MKRCKACDEEFKDKYSYCPVDSTPLNMLPESRLTEVAHCSRDEFQLTILDNSVLPERLTKELNFLISQMRQAWPIIKGDPIGSSRRAVTAARMRFNKLLAEPNSMAAIATALAILSGAILIVFSGGMSNAFGVVQTTNHDELVEVVELLPVPDVGPQDSGVGVGSRGRVGFANGRGEGSSPKPKKSTGGGGGGNHDLLPAQQGRVPPPSPIPAPIPKAPVLKNQTLPAAGIDIDPALWSNLPMALYGDPRSKSSFTSNGPGNNGGMGNSDGTGIGDGNGPGVGPGQDGNTGGGRKGPPGGGGPGGSDGNNPDAPDRVYPALQVTERARVISKPEPQYTEDARRNQITGSVVLRVVFSRTGEVTNIRALHSLPFGLTERAIAAARLIRFRPAIKDGQPVNVYMQLEYNFNLY